MTTKMLSVYARWKGSAYLKSTLQKVLERLIVTAQDLDLELDPSRTSSPEELQRNTLQLRVVAKVFIDDICSSAPDMPISFRNICSIVSISNLCVFSATNECMILDIYIRHGTFSRREVHGCWRVHFLAILLPSHCRSGRRGSN